MWRSNRVVQSSQRPKEDLNKKSTGQRAIGVPELLDQIWCFRLKQDLFDVILRDGVAQSGTHHPWVSRIEWIVDVSGTITPSGRVKCSSQDTILREYEYCKLCYVTDVAESECFQAKVSTF